MAREEVSIENRKPAFIFPSFNKYDEAGEIERVQQYFGIKTSNFVQKFVERAKQGRLIKLTDDIWDTVENTDSHSDNVPRGDWNTVAHIVGQVQRDWQTLRNKMQRGEEMDAPIIARRGDILHLVTGNTRLCIARAAGVKPDVLIVDISGIE